MSDKGDSRIVVLAFPEEDADFWLDENFKTAEMASDYKDSQALAVWKLIKKEAKEANIKLKDAAIVYKYKTGTVKIKQIMELTPAKGAKRGTFWGLLVGLVLGGPIGGALLGLVAGTIFGKAVDRGIDNNFIKQVGEAMQPLSSAIFVLVREENYEHVIPYLHTFGAEIYESTLSKSAEQAVAKALENENVAKVVDEEMH